MIKDFVIIKCPKCGYEYAAAEIFYTDGLLGKPNSIIRDDDGHIILIEGEQPDIKEQFECERCGTLFRTTLSIDSETKYNKNLDKDDFVMNLNDKENLF